MYDDIMAEYESPSNNNMDFVCLSYDELIATCNNTTITNPNSVDMNTLIERAFSSDGLGIIAITDVPNLPQLRHRLLPLAQKLATLPADQLDEVTDPESGYQVGWSHGREKLEGDKPDWSKGSFYANPLTEDLVESMLDRRTYQRPNNKIIDGNVEEVLDWDESIDVVKTDDELRELAKSNPAFFAPNVWPSKHLPELESTFKDVGKLVHEVGLLVAKCCDSYVSSNVSICYVGEFGIRKICSHVHLLRSQSTPKSALDMIQISLKILYAIPSAAKLDCFITFQLLKKIMLVVIKLHQMWQKMIQTLVVGVAGTMITAHSQAYFLLCILIVMVTSWNAQMLRLGCISNLVMAS